MAATPEQQAAAEAYRQRKAAEQEARENTPSQLGRTIAQGLTFGTADELEAWLNTSTDEEYEQMLNEIRGNLEAYKQARPIQAGLAEIGGALIPTVVATVLSGGTAALAQIGARLPRVAQIIGRATGNILGATGTQTVVGGALVGAGQGALTGFGTGEGGLENRLKSATGGAVVGAGLGAGGEIAGKVIGKTLDGMLDWARRNKGARASSAAEREIQRIAQERGITADEAFQMVQDGSLLVENKTLRDIMRTYRATGGEAAEILRKGLQPRPSATRKEVTEYLERTLGGADQNIIQAKNARLAELQEQAGKLYKADWADANVPQELVTQMATIFKAAPKAFDEVEEAITARPGAEMFFKLDEAGRLQVTGMPTIGQAEMVRRAIANRVSTLYKEGKGTAAEELSVLEESLREIIDGISDKTRQARATWRQMHNEGEAFDVGKSVTKATTEFDVAQDEWHKALALGDETTSAFRLGVMSSLRRMLGGGSAASTIKKLLDEDNAQGQLLREIFPEQDLPEMLRRLSVAKDANEAANEILGQSPTAITNALIKQQKGDIDLLDLAIDGASTIGVARLIGSMLKRTQPELTPDQRTEVVMLLMSQDANRIKQLLQDESGLAQMQKRVAQAVEAIKTGAIRSSTQMQAQPGTTMMEQLVPQQ